MYRTQLFEFLCDLIDIQIKKYVALAEKGIGPDARLNAKLVFNEVTELLDFAKQVLAEIQSPPADNSNFIHVLNQTKFYTNQEYVRAYAGWLLAENNIHSTVKERVEEQLKQVQHIEELIDLKSATSPMPVTNIQKQCQHDSIAIAFHILNLAQQIKSNPEIEQPTGLPTHAFVILKANATTRYVQLSEEIERLHHQYETFLKDSLLEKTSSTLERAEARQHEAKHREQFNALLRQYNEINPDSSLFSASHPWHQVGTIKPEMTSKSASQKSFCSSNLTLFGGVALGVCVISLLMKYIADQFQSSSLDSPINLN